MALTWSLVRSVVVQGGLLKNMLIKPTELVKHIDEIEYLRKQIEKLAKCAARASNTVFTAPLKDQHSRLGAVAVLT